MFPAATFRMTIRCSWHHQVRCSSAVPETPEGGQPLPRRRSANYQPSSWDYDALLSLKGRDGRDLELSPCYDKLKDSIMDLMHSKAEPYCKLKAIDTMQRLGISYHFEQEISSVLNSMSMENADDRHMDDIALTALKFRLLRENGFPTDQETLR